MGLWSLSALARQIRVGLRCATWCVCLALLWLAPSFAASSPEYRLAAGDLLTVDLLSDGTLSYEAPVLTDGSITVPYAGRVLCGERTCQEVQEAVQAACAKTLKTAQVTVYVKTPRPQFVYCLGSGVTSNAIPYAPGLRITQALAQVGGVNARPNVLLAWLRRPSGEVRPVDLSGLLLTGRPEADLELQEGDVLVVERVDTAGVYVTGSVVAPGAYSLGDGLRATDRLRTTVSLSATEGVRTAESAAVTSEARPIGGATAARAIVAAGGIAPGADVKHVVVWQANRTRVEVDLSEALFQGDFSKDVTVRPGDVVVVPATEQSALVFTVVGDVNRPGYYTLREGQPTTVADAIGLAGGLRAPDAPIALLRNVDNRPTSVVRPLPELLAEPLQVGDLLIVGEQALGRAQ